MKYLFLMGASLSLDHIAPLPRFPITMPTVNSSPIHILYLPLPWGFQLHSLWCLQHLVQATAPSIFIERINRKKKCLKGPFHKLGSGKASWTPTEKRTRRTQLENPNWLVDLGQGVVNTCQHTPAFSMALGNLGLA